MNQTGRPTRPLRFIALLAVVHVLGCLNLFYPVVRLSFQFTNYFVFALLQLVPLKIVHMASTRSGWSRWPVLVMGALLVMLAIPLGVGAVGCAALAVPADYSFERRQSVPTDVGAIAVYRTNGGATTAFGIVVRQECRVLPGVVLVRQFANESTINADLATDANPRDGDPKHVTPTEADQHVPTDPDDNRVLECAVSAGSQTTVTGDDDLLRLVAFRDIEIVMVADFLTQFSAGS